MSGSFLQLIIGDYMKNEMKIEELQKPMPSTRPMILQVAGVQIFLAAFLFSGEKIIHFILLLMGILTLTVGFGKWNLFDKLKQTMK